MKTPKIDLERLKRFKYAIINVVGQDGYPWSLPTDFQVTTQGEIVLGMPGWSRWLEGKRVGVLFSHITAIPTGGYTERRYMLIWGNLSEHQGKLKLQPDALSEWDEEILPFDQLCARAAPQGQKYLESLQNQIEA